MRQVCVEGPGHYLGHQQTLSLMQSEYVYPAIGNRMSPKEWNEADKPDIIEVAIAKRKELLARCFPSHIDDTLDARLREKFPVKLPRESMQPA